MRIIAGSARGRRFDAPKGMDTRPTLDRVKEAVFGMIHFQLPGSAVLDLFSGSGNLGLEAASRGAGYVVCNDRSPVCVQQIKSNVEQLGFGDVITVTQRDFLECIRVLASKGRKFDFVFLDAPYADGTAAQAAEALLNNDLLAPDGRIFIEHALELPPKLDPTLGLDTDTRRYGKCAVTILKGTKFI